MTSAMTAVARMIELRVRVSVCVIRKKRRLSSATQKAGYGEPTALGYVGDTGWNVVRNSPNKRPRGWVSPDSVPLGCHAFRSPSDNLRITRVEELSTLFIRKRQRG